ncbi:hypothetical protein KEM48_009995 [Puccinia striiformis f. sp. tritici PST-130]|nr:hypothetical protein KEM48_009995 [Puccinia striiformis f. sp. tritici PST-130]
MSITKLLKLTPTLSVREPPNSQEGHSILEGFPLLVGLSRKKFLAQLLTPSSSASLPDPKDRLVPTIVASTIAIVMGLTSYALMILLSQNKLFKPLMGFGLLLLLLLPLVIDLIFR